MSYEIRYLVPQLHPGIRYESSTFVECNILLSCMDEVLRFSVCVRTRFISENIFVLLKLVSRKFLREFNFGSHRPVVSS